MRIVADAKRVDELIDDLARQIRRDMAQARSSRDAEQTGGEDGGWALVGIRSRGDLLAQRLAQKLDPKAIDGRVGTLDITLYRDDLSEIGAQAVVRTTEVPFRVDGLNIMLVDDVLMTGRSIRAALQSLMDLGRPRRVWLIVLVDRGGRELPIAPDHVGLDLSDKSAADGPGSGELVEVRLVPTDAQDSIVVRRKGEA